MKVMISSDGGHAHLFQRMAWANAFSVFGIDVALWDCKNTPAFDAFDSFEPDIFLGQSYNLDEPTIKCIYERPHLRIGLRAGDWGVHENIVDNSVNLKIRMVREFQWINTQRRPLNIYKTFNISKIQK